MSQLLYALVVLQGTTFTFAPGYTSAAACREPYRGPNVICFEYDPAGVTWTAFFKTQAGGFGTVWRFPNESLCQNYIGALRSDVPSACRQLAHPEPCPVSCVAPVQPPPPTGTIPPKPEVTPPPPDPASIETKPSDIEVGGKQYTRVAGLSWVERESRKPNSFADVSVGPTELQSKDKPTPLPPKVQTAQAPQRQAGYAPPQYAQHPEPLKVIVDTLLLPWDFLNYPGRRDNW